jgi:thiopeptide-type bacteriocin biosynthesis protein
VADHESRSRTAVGWRMPEEGIVLRAPLFSVDALARLEVASSMDPAGGGSAGAEQTWSALSAALRELLQDPRVREALFLASPALDESIDEWLRGPEDGSGRLVRSLLAYVTRMCTRATPFGLFAGVGIVRLSGSTSLDLGRDPLRRRTRLDYGFLTALTADVAGSEQVRAHACYTPNSSLYQAGGRLRMLEARMQGDGRVRYVRTTFAADEALTLVLDRARRGARLSELVDALCSSGAHAAEATEYLEELVREQLLVPDLGPLVTGPDPISHLLRRLPEGSREHSVIADISSALHSFDRAAEPVRPAEYRAAAEGLRALDVPFDISRLLQVDAGRDAHHLTVGPRVTAAMQQAVDVLDALAPAPTDEFKDFRRRFVDRYGEREVPFAEALDEEIGIGYRVGRRLSSDGQPLLAGMPTPPSSAQGPAWTAADNHRLRLLIDALSSRKPVELSRADLDTMRDPRRAPLPDALSVSVVLAADSAEAIDRGDFRLLVRGVAGPSGARTIGRFCDVLSSVEACVREHVQAEQALRPDVIYAEIVHLPEGRVGNVVARPLLRPYEIAFLGASGADHEHQIRLDELTLAVEGDRVVLRCPRLGLEVVPRLTSAHNALMGGLPAYRFLAALEQQGVSGGVGWSWGPLQAARFLPRVTMGRLVLSRAQWSLDAAEVTELSRPSTIEGRYQAVQQLRRMRDLPRRVVLATGDRELPVDLDTLAGTELFAYESRKTQVLYEQFPVNEDQPLTSDAGRFTHQLVVPLVRNRTARAAATTRLLMREDPGGAEGRSGAVDRGFPPGSRWLTVKLYTGAASADLVLSEAVGPLYDELRSSGRIDRWFFLRYGDPEWHVRVRFRVAESSTADAVLGLFHDRLQLMLDTGVVGDVRLDTYRPEVRRYGGAGTFPLAERYFDLDSSMVLQLLRDPEVGLDERWRLALLTVHSMLVSTELPLSEARHIVQSWRNGLVEQQGAQGQVARRWAGQVYRQQGAALQNLVEAHADGARLPAGARVIVSEEGPRRALLRELVEACSRGEMDRPLAPVLGSLAHMHVNRLLRAAQPVQELVVYDLLDRLYASRLARAGAR